MMRTIVSLAMLLMPALPAAAQTTFGEIERLDERINHIIPAGAELEVLAEGYAWLEGPAWNKQGGFLLFSDIPANAIHRWDDQHGARLFLQPSGYSGAEPFSGREPGSNGLLFDAEGRLILCEHGDRRLTRLEANGTKTVLAEVYEGKLLNSPNDAKFASDGSLYFTDPPFGLPKAFKDPAKELDFQGVYRLSTDGRLDALLKDIAAPNGIAFSPEGRRLYLTDVGSKRPAWLVYDVAGDGSLRNGRVFHDARPFMKDRKGGPDGLEVDEEGNLYGAGPEAVYIFAPDGSHLGSIFTGVPTGNIEWGDDGSTLYITADTRLLRIRLKSRGPGFR